MHFPCSVSPCIWGAGYLVSAPPLTVHKIMANPNESGWDMAPSLHLSFLLQEVSLRGWLGFHPDLSPDVRAPSPDSVLRASLMGLCTVLAAFIAVLLTCPARGLRCSPSPLDANL